MFHKEEILSAFVLVVGNNLESSCVSKMKQSGGMLFSLCNLRNNHLEVNSKLEYKQSFVGFCLWALLTD